MAQPYPAVRALPRTNHLLPGRIREVLDDPDPAGRRAILTAHPAGLEERMTLLRGAREVVEREMVCLHERP